MSIHPESLQNLKIIVCDLDGTLVNMKKEIMPISEKVLIQLEQQGYILILASGRFFYETFEYIKQLKMLEYPSYVLCANGCEIHDLQAKKKYTFPTLDSLMLSHLIQAAEKHRLVCYFNENKQYHIHLPKQGMQSIVQTMQTKSKAMFQHAHGHFIDSFHSYDFSDYEPQELLKMCFLGLPEDIKTFKQDMRRQYKDYIFYDVNEMVTEIVRKEVGKKEAMEFILSKLPYTLDQVLCFGDAGNDVKLLKEAGLGIAMNNAMRNAKGASDYICKYSCEEDGVGKMLEALFF